MNIRYWLIRKLADKKNLKKLFRANENLMTEYIDEHFDYYMHRYLARQHVNCRCFIHKEGLNGNQSNK